MSSDFNRYPKIDLGTQPWSVPSVFYASGGCCQAYAGRDHGGSILEFERTESTASTPSRRLSAAVQACRYLGGPQKYARITQATDENTRPGERLGYGRSGRRGGSPGA